MYLRKNIYIFLFCTIHTQPILSFLYLTALKDAERCVWHFLLRPQASFILSKSVCVFVYLLGILKLQYILKTMEFAIDILIANSLFIMIMFLTN